MKKGGLLHPDLNLYLSLLGHTDLFCVADAGLPIPDGVSRVDLALVPGRLSFDEVVDAILKETVVEKAFCARESSEKWREALRRRLGRECELETVSHEDLKDMLHSVRFVVRTGECTPFSNVILRSGVFF